MIFSKICKNKVLKIIVSWFWMYFNAIHHSERTKALFRLLKTQERSSMNKDWHFPYWMTVNVRFPAQTKVPPIFIVVHKLVSIRYELCQSYYRNDPLKYDLNSLIIFNFLLYSFLFFKITVPNLFFFKNLF